jgi:putative hydrolase of HD superfamily
MSNLQNSYQLILEINKLKDVYRHNLTKTNRQESSAEHSWSAAMICFILMPQLKQEFPNIDEHKVLQLVLIHDLVEIYAGDISTFDVAGRKKKAKEEQQVIDNFTDIEPEIGQQIVSLWQEFEAIKTTEAKVAKAADAICPIFMRVKVKQSLNNIEVSPELFESRKLPYFTFSATFTELYHQLLKDLHKYNLI